jgi:hypothetical protein
MDISASECARCVIATLELSVRCAISSMAAVFARLTMLARDVMNARLDSTISHNACVIINLLFNFNTNIRHKCNML